MKRLDTECAVSGETREEALLALLKSVPEGSAAFHTVYAHYRQYHVSGDAMRDRDAAVLAQYRTGA